MRLFSTLVFLAVLLTGPAHAQNWPNRSVHIIVPFGPGGVGDLLARMIGDRLTDVFKQPFVVENRTGAGGMLGAQQGAAADPDGHTLTLTNLSTLCLVPLINTNTPYDPVGSFTHISYLAGAPAVLSVPPASGARTLKDFVERAKSLRRPLNFGSTGVGSDGHVVGETIGRMLGIQVTHTPYRATTQAITDLMADHIDFLPFTVGAIGETVKSGKVNGLAVAAATRSPGLPDVPTFKELGYPDMVTLTWFSLSGPAKLPAPIVETLNREIALIFKSPEMLARLTQLGLSTETMSPGEITAFVTAESRRWKPMVEAAGLVGKGQ